MSKLISECIFKNNFNRFGHKVLIRNESSHTLSTKPELITIKELKITGLVLEVPINVCQKGHQLTVFFMPLDFKYFTKLPDFGRYKESLFEAVAKVDSIEKIPGMDASVIIDIHFTQYKNFEWKIILDEYASNQEEINKMIMLQHLEREKE
jgi:hypothetical protein